MHIIPHAFSLFYAYSMLLRCLLKFKRLACGSEDFTQYNLFMCYCTEYNLSALQVNISEENKLNTTRQQFIIAKIPG